jgi:hypothetical protein
MRQRLTILFVAQLMIMHILPAAAFAINLIPENPVAGSYVGTVKATSLAIAYAGVPSEKLHGSVHLYGTTIKFTALYNQVTDEVIGFFKAGTYTNYLITGNFDSPRQAFVLTFHHKKQKTKITAKFKAKAGRIGIVEATYDCGSKADAGDASSDVAAQCDNEKSCSYVVDKNKYGTICSDGVASFRLVFTCGGAHAPTTFDLNPEEDGIVNGHGITLSCS